MPRSPKVQFRCEACATPHRWRRHLAGKRAKCPCGHVMIVPQGPASPPKAPRPTADVAPAGPKTRAPAGSWKWWYGVAAGGLVAAFSLYRAVPDFHLGPLTGLVLGVVSIAFGLWSRR